MTAQYNASTVSRNVTADQVTVAVPSEFPNYSLAILNSQNRDSLAAVRVWCYTKMTK